MKMVNLLEKCLNKLGYMKKISYIYIVNK